MTLDTQVKDAHAAWLQIRDWDSSKIVSLLESIADALDIAKADLVPVAMEETNLPEARLTGEVGRTTGQLRLMARAVADRTYLDSASSRSSSEDNVAGCCWSIWCQQLSIRIWCCRRRYSISTCCWMRSCHQGKSRTSTCFANGRRDYGCCRN